MICTRFAPSPTGYLHIGGARTALYSWLYARKRNGKFILRIEDTDLERSTQQAVDAILDAMQWLQLDSDGPIVHQTQRFDRYKEVVEKLLAEKKAYYCNCSHERLETLRNAQMEAGEKPKYDGHCKKNPPANTQNCVIRLAAPTTGSVHFVDHVHGNMEIQQAELDDFVMVRSDNIPTYNFCVVVDDIDMQITHVIRGDDHLANTPKQVNLYNALGVTPPEFVHVPMILGADSKRLSKRHGAVAVQQYKDAGILPQALLNYLVRLGWSHGDQELFSTQEMIEFFDIDRLNKAPATFNMEKLLWINHQKMMHMDNAELAQTLIQFKPDVPQENLAAICGLFKERAPTLVDLLKNAHYVLYDDFVIEESAQKMFSAENLPILQFLHDALENCAWNEPAIKEVIHAGMEKFALGFGKIAQPLRAVLTGAAQTPPMAAVVELLGKKRTLARLHNSIKIIQKGA